MKITSIIKSFGVLLLLSPIVVLPPIFTISSLNILFELNIEYNFVTWLSAFWINLLVGAEVTKGD